MSQNILVTGTNSGFGRLIALSLAKQGHQVFATMREVAGRNAQAREALEKEGAGRLHVVEMGLTDEAEVARAVHGVLERVGHIDAIVSNAGFMTLGLAETVTGEQLRDMFDVNVIGAHRILRAVLPSMRARGKGLFVQVSSAAGRLVFPVMGTYGATKFALESLCEAYRYELKPLGIDVTILQPGGYPTDIMRRSVVGNEQERAEAYGPMKEAVAQAQQNFESMFSRADAPDPQHVADAVAKLIEAPAGSRPPRVVVDPQFGAVVESANRAIAEAQRALLTALRMGPLAD